MDANVHIQPVAIGIGDPRTEDQELAKAVAELRAAQASKDQVWQARAARHVAKLQQQRKTRSL